MLLYMLGWRPDEFGLFPVEDDFFKLKDVHLALTEVDGFKGVRRRQLEVFFEAFGNEEFELIKEKGLVRAKEKHWGPPAYSETVPKLLYLAIKPRRWIKVSEEGISEEVVLFCEEDLAKKVAKRKGAIVITVEASRAQREGAVFFRFVEKLFTSSWLPPSVLKGPKVDEKFKKRYLPKPKEEPEPEPIPLSVDEPDVPELPYRKITGGKKKRIPWKEDRRRRKKRL